MKELAKEVYSNTLHIWYQTDITTAHEYGEIFDTSSSSLDKIATRMQEDMVANPDVEAVYCTWVRG
ncbi:TPA: hypothetical protein U1D11_000142 [Streptococcus suis]|nr:hypothetical protein [Streptococcus suis]